MAAINKFTPPEVKASAGTKKLLDGGGLYLVPEKNGSASWILRFTDTG